MSCKNAMHDGRAFTDYTPNCSMNEYFQHNSSADNSVSYRLFLQRNGNQLIGFNQKRAEYQNVAGCRCMYGHPPHNEEWNPKPYSSNDTSYIMKYHHGQVTPFSHAQNTWY